MGYHCSLAENSTCHCCNTQGVIAAGLGIGALGTGWLVSSRGLRPAASKSDDSQRGSSSRTQVRPVHACTNMFVTQSHTQICPHTHTQAHTHNHTNKNVYTCTFANTHTHTHTHAHTFAHPCAHMQGSASSSRRGRQSENDDEGPVVSAESKSIDGG